MYGLAYQVPKPLRGNLAFLLRVASERAIEIFDGELAAKGIHSRHASILALAEEHSLNQNMIAEATQTHPNAVIGLIDTLEEKGLATREQNPANRREYLVRVTPTGRKVIRQLEKAIETGTAKFTGHLNTDEKADLTRLLLKCIEAWAG
jgi:DNA-binding MarR family transcriptional regulator